MRRHLLAVSLIAAAATAMGAGTIDASSGVFDESIYLRLGREVFATGRAPDFWCYGIAPLPVVLAYSTPVLGQLTAYPAAIVAARWTALLLFGVPVLVLIYGWLAARQGRALATAAALFVALSPTFFAHASLATTDTAAVASSLLVLVVLERTLDRPSRRRLAWLTLSLGVAFAAKYSAIALTPVIAAALVLATPRRTTTWSAHLVAVAQAGTLTAAIVSGALVVAWALHGFTIATLDARHLGVAVPMPAPVYGVLYQMRHASLGHPGFLLGEQRHTGWWYYTPVALWLKTTPAEWMLCAGALVALARREAEAPWRLTLWRLAFVSWTLLAMASRVNVGVRYVLILFPLAALIATDWLGRVRAQRPRLVGALVTGLLVAQAWSAVTARPAFLSYINRAAGGPAAGYRLLADSNLDWGQELPALARTLREVDAERPIVAFFGTAPFDAYDVHATRWPGTPDDQAAADWIVISSTLWNGLYWSEDPFARFRALTPTARAGHGLLLYRLDRPDTLTAFREALRRRPVP